MPKARCLVRDLISADVLFLLLQYGAIQTAGTLLMDCVNTTRTAKELLAAGVDK